MEMCNADVGKLGCDVKQHGFALFQSIGGLFIGISADGDNEFVKHGLCLANHPQVAVGGRVEAAGINGTAVGVFHGVVLQGVATIPAIGHGWLTRGVILAFWIVAGEEYPVGACGASF